MSSDSEDYSDEDYNPEKDTAEAGSEVESDGDIEDDLPDSPSDSSKQTGKETLGKRKGKSANLKSKRVKATEVEENCLPEAEEGNSEEAEKKRAEALWADFLGGDAPTSEEPKEERRRAPAASKIEVKKAEPPPPVPERKREPVVIKEIFEYAGEQVVIEKEVKEPVAQTGTSKRGLTSTGGLGSVLGALNKKNKISTLEKTKLDWDRFKNQEGITEDLNTHNRGKDGYLERQDFLQRTDVRQFELERSIRQTTRSNR